MTDTREASVPAAPVAPPVDFVTPQLTLRALGTGVILGGVLSICNVYTGLKIGWGLNMSITGILLAYVMWLAISRASARSSRTGTPKASAPWS